MKTGYFLLFLLFWTAGVSYAFDISGLQPVSPNGVFSTFSAESLPRSKASFEVTAERSGDPNFYRVSLKGAYGLTDALELNLTVPYIFDFGRTDGLEDSAIGLKHRFYDEGKYGPSLAYLLNVSLPNGRDEFSTDGRLGMVFVVSKRVGPFKGHMNFSYEVPGAGRFNKELCFLGGIEFSAAHNFNLLGEILAKIGHAGTKYEQLEARLGYRIKTTDYIYTTLGVGFDLKKRNPEYRGMLSISVTSSREKKKIQKIFEEE